jgi:hypothetical protein
MKYLVTISEVEPGKTEFIPHSTGEQTRAQYPDTGREIYRREVPDLDVLAVIIAVDQLDRVPEPPHG